MKKRLNGNSFSRCAEDSVSILTSSLIIQVHFQSVFIFWSGFQGYENFPASDFFIELLPKTAGKNEVDAFLNFIYELSEQNCTHPGGLYHEIYRERSERPPQEADKVKLICNTIAEKAREDEERLSKSVQDEAAEEQGAARGCLCAVSQHVHRERYDLRAAEAKMIWNKINW